MALAFDLAGRSHANDTRQRLRGGADIGESFVIFDAPLAPAATRQVLAHLRQHPSTWAANR
jgi:hypothetical protein